MEIGQRFRSIAIGDKPAFVGEVVFIGDRGYVHLRDSNGDDWHRLPDELSPLPPRPPRVSRSRTSSKE